MSDISREVEKLKDLVNDPRHWGEWIPHIGRCAPFSDQYCQAEVVDNAGQKFLLTGWVRDVRDPRWNPEALTEGKADYRVLRYRINASLPVKAARAKRSKQ